MTDTCCTIVPYFEVQEGKLDAFKAIVPQMIASTEEEPLCLFYGFCFNGNTAHCREGYQNAEGVLTHIEHVGPFLEQALAISELVRLEIHGPAEELEKLKQPLAELSPQYFTLEGGFRR